jgi:hypothetical protein
VLPDMDGVTQMRSLYGGGLMGTIDQVAATAFGSQTDSSHFKL